MNFLIFQNFNIKTINPYEEVRLYDFMNRLNVCDIQVTMRNVYCVSYFKPAPEIKQQ